VMFSFPFISYCLSLTFSTVDTLHCVVSDIHRHLMSARVNRRIYSVPRQMNTVKHAVNDAVCLAFVLFSYIFCYYETALPLRNPKTNSVVKLVILSLTAQNDGSLKYIVL
ncbi:hypothetical protein L9F63_020252, partial [Diploptera punctata]